MAIVNVELQRLDSDGFAEIAWIFLKIDYDW